MAGRQGPRTSTPRLLVWAVLMFALGMGVSTLLTSQGCRKKGQVPGDEEPAAPRAVPKKPAPRATPAVPVVPEEKPAPPPGKVSPPPSELPRLALIIDDLGYAPPELVTRLCAQPVALSVAVLPYQEHTRISAEIAHDQGKEVMLHLPMEPLGYPGPGKDPGPNAVMASLTEAQTRERVRQALAEIPFRKGANNHMGSRITPDRARMTWILQELKAKHCFFVDSRTEKDSVAFEVAQALAIPSVERKVFLDDDKDFQAMAKQWDRALALAGKDGHTVVIGHIYPETVAALEKLIPMAKGKVAFVKASELAK